MFKKDNKSKGVVKGAPSGVLISIAIHAGAFALAGVLVVFKVFAPPPAVFTPPELPPRTEMKLKKPKVSVTRSAKPKPTDRITAKPKDAAMPDIVLPDVIGGTGGQGLGDGFEGIELMPDLEEISTMGSTISSGSDFEGTYYDLKYTSDGRWAPMAIADECAVFREWFYLFIKSGWDINKLDRFYESPRKLYANCFVLPPSISAMAPVAFGMEEEKASGGMWLVHYKGKLVHKEDITFRFWLSCDDTLAIRVDGELVAASSWSGAYHHPYNLDRFEKMFRGEFDVDSIASGKMVVGHSYVNVGDWITLKAGEPKEMEMVATDNEYQNASYVVMVEVQGEEYPTGSHGGPLLPIFKTSKLSHDQLDLIYESLPEGEADCINGPIFSDY